MLAVFSKKYSSMKKIIEKLRIQRNKIVAHNSEEIFLDNRKMMEIEKISLEDESILITYALDLTQFISYALKGEYLPNKFHNINDIDVLFAFVKDGYQVMKDRDKNIMNMMRGGYNADF